MKRILLSALLAFAASGTIYADSHGSAGSVTAVNPYVRAIPPGATVSAAFMQLKNGDKSDHSLVAAQSPAAKSVELHTHTLKDGMMMMRQVKKIDLPAGKTVELKPGGLHIMLIGLTKALKPGDQVELTLIYEDGNKSKITAPVKKIMGGQMKNMKH